MSNVHTPVMLRQVVEYMDPSPGKRFIDATLGAGGHTLALLEKGASVVGIDRDAEIIQYAMKKISAQNLSSNFNFIHTSFAEALGKNSDGVLNGEYDGVFFDLGVSSFQLDTPGRGFSLRHDGPLDMRMDKALTVTAADLVNGLGKKELVELFTTLGEDRFSPQVASAIIKARKSSPLKSTSELVKIIESVVKKSNSKTHPAARYFQALRMAVNLEREELKAALPSALSWLREGGVLAVITFHSLEEAIVTQFFLSLAAQGQLELLTPQPETPTVSELKTNNRARSARLRAVRKTKGGLPQ